MKINPRLPSVFLAFITIFSILTVGATNISANAERDAFSRLPGTVDEKKANYEKIVEEGHPSLEVFVHSVLTALQHNGLTVILGPTGNERDVGDIEPKLNDRGLDNGVIPALAGIMSEMYVNKPASINTYIADVAQSAKIIPSTHAQGLGFASLDPILTIWKTFRNIAYFFFVIIFVVIGFMIMFRHKISGQTVTTVEQAIPNVIVALLFVTFSYAIAGLMIDLMYLTMYILVGLFSGSAEVINYDIFKLGLELMREGTRVGASSAITSLIRAAGVRGIFEWISSLTLAVIMGIAILFGVFKLFFELLKSYISIILSIAFSPIFLMIGAIPGQNTFNKWFKSLAGNLAAFPAVLLLLLVQKVIQQGAFKAGRGGFLPPFLLGSGVGGALPALVAIGILLAMPEVVKKVKEAIGAKEGVFEQLGQSAWARGVSTSPVPLRLAGLGAGAVGGAAGGALIGLGDAALNKGKYSRILDYARGDRGPAGYKKGVKSGVDLAGRVSRSLGANQPDVLNPFVNQIDKMAGVDQKEELTTQSLERMINVLREDVLASQEGKKEAESVDLLPRRQ